MVSHCVSGRLGIVIIAALAVLAMAPAQAARALYVDVALGDDQNSGSASDPYRTIRMALTHAAAGTSVYLRPGRYNESLFRAIPSGVTVSGSNRNRRAVIAAPAGSLRVVDLTDVSDVTLQDLVLDGSRVSLDALKVSDAPRVLVQRVEIFGAPEQGVLVVDDHATSSGFWLLDSSVNHCGTTDFHHGVYLSSDDARVERVEVFRNAGWGVHVFHEGGTVHRASLRALAVSGNATAGARGDGVILSSGDSHVLEDSTIEGNAQGVVVDYGATRAIVRHVLVRSASSGVAVRVGTGASDTRLDRVQYDGAQRVIDDGARTIMLSVGRLVGPTAPRRIFVQSIGSLFGAPTAEGARDSSTRVGWAPRVE